MRGDELDAATLYALLRLRVDVFVVEQRCPYPELDGLDLDPATQHCFVLGADGIEAAVRLVRGDTSWRLTRVVTAPAARGRGLAARLVAFALELAGRPVVCDAQAHLEGWYRRFGFQTTGGTFLEDGIPHVPMRLSA